MERKAAMAASIMSWSLERKIAVGFGLALAMLAAVGLVQHGTIRTLVETDQRVAHTNAVLTELEGAYAAIVAVESQARAYVVIGEPRSLGSTDSSIADAQKHIWTLRKLMADNPSQQRNLDHLEAIAKRKIDFMRRVIALRRERGSAAAVKIMGTREGLGLMDDMRGLVDAMRAEEESLLRARHAASQAAARTAGLVSTAGTLLALCLGLAAIWIINKDVAKRKLAESELRRAGAYNRSLIEASLDPLVTISPDGKITDVNSATERVTGFSRQELIGTDFADYFTEPERARAGYQQVFREGQVQDYELEIRRRDGHLTPVIYNASVYRGEGGAIVGVFAAARDITERKRAEEAARRANAYNRSLIEASLDPLVTISPDGKITDVNSTTERVTGFSRQELIGTDFSDYFTEPERARAGYQQVFREGQVQDYGLEIRHRDGRVTPVIYNASVYRDESGATVGVFAAARDITERKRAEEAARRANAYNRSLIEASLDPLVTISPEGKITDVNLATEKVTGFSRRELIGTDFSNYFSAPERARAGYRQVFREGQVQDYGLEIRHRDGHLTPVIYNASVYRDESGAIVGVFAAARDITEQARAERELQKLNLELEQRVQDRTAALEASNRELEAFSYTVSHDLRAPLRAIDGFSRILLEEHAPRLGEDAQHFLDVVRQNAVRMGDLIDDLLKFARLGRQALGMRTVATAALVQQAFEELRSEQEGRQVEFRITDLPQCHGDPQLLRQVFVNLLSNALKYTRRRETARIEVGALSLGDLQRQGDHSQPVDLHDPKCVVYYVRDNGLGFDMQYVGKLFGVFQRLHRVEEFEGTGVGLAIVQRIIRRHDGHVWARGEVDKGATFYFTLGDQRSDTRAAGADSTGGG